MEQPGANVLHSWAESRQPWIQPTLGHRWLSPCKGCVTVRGQSWAVPALRGWELPLYTVPFPDKCSLMASLLYRNQSMASFFLCMNPPGLSKSFEVVLAARKCPLNNEAECFPLRIFILIILLLMFSLHSENCAFCAALIIIYFSFFQTLSEIAILAQCFKL